MIFTRTWYASWQSWSFPKFPSLAENILITIWMLWFAFCNFKILKVLHWVWKAVRTSSSVYSDMCLGLDTLPATLVNPSTARASSELIAPLLPLLDFGTAFTLLSTWSPSAFTSQVNSFCFCLVDTPSPSSAAFNFLASSPSWSLQVMLNRLLPRLAWVDFLPKSYIFFLIFTIMYCFRFFCKSSFFHHF